MDVTPELHNSIFLKACRREPTPRPPIWLMRQVGRYMKEYRELREKKEFLEICKSSELSAQLTVNGVEKLGVDAGIIFSDLLLLVEPLGYLLSYQKDHGPVISNRFNGPHSLRHMCVPDIRIEMNYVLKAIRMARERLPNDIPLIGFAGAPFTMASYIIEGEKSKSFMNTRRLMSYEPAMWHQLLEAITIPTIDYLNAQIQSGVQCVQIFDSWVGSISAEEYQEFVLPHTRRLIQGITKGVPVISFGTQTTHLLPLLKAAGGDVIGVDWRIDLDKAWEMIGPECGIMGNMDPTVLLTKPEKIENEANRIIALAQGRPGHIFNLGHGVLPATPFENVVHLVQYVRSFNRTF